MFLKRDQAMATVYAFGPFRLDEETEILFRGTEPTAVGQRAVALLRALVERPGAPVSKDVLIEAAWPGLVVEEGICRSRSRRYARCSARSPAARAGSRRCRGAGIGSLGLCPRTSKTMAAASLCPAPRGADRA